MLSQKEPVLTDMMLRYPFVHHSRRFFDSIPIEESFSSREVVRQAEMRLMSALGRANYEPHVTELVEFSSFFVSAFVASQESLLAGRFAKREAERSRGLFEREDARDKATVIRECFGIGIQYGGDSRYGYSAGVEEYLALVSKYELAKAQRWKLVRFFFSSRRRHTRFDCDWSSDVCSSDLVFAIQSEIAKAIASQLQAKLSPSQANTLAAKPTRDTEAYDLFLKGEYQERQAESKIGRASCRERV